MLDIRLEDVQAFMPLRRVYAWHWAYIPALKEYRCHVWMDQNYLGESKTRYDRMVPEALAVSRNHVLRLLDESISAELEKRGILA